MSWYNTVGIFLFIGSIIMGLVLFLWLSGAIIGVVDGPPHSFELTGLFIVLFQLGVILGGAE